MGRHYSGRRIGVRAGGADLVLFVQQDYEEGRAASDPLRLFLVIVTDNSITVIFF